MSRKMVSLVGMDGSGKSANLNLMKQDEDFEDFLFLWVRWEPYLLKPLYNILNKKQKTVSISLNESYKKKDSLKKKIFKNKMVKAIWLFFAVIDYKIGYRKKTKSAFLSNKNIVFDRNYIDLFIDQGINFQSTPQEIEKSIRRFAFLFPSIDKTIYIRVKPEICFSRKNDIPNMQYLLVRWDIYEHLSNVYQWKIIDGEQSLDDVYLKIKKELI